MRHQVADQRVAGDHLARQGAGFDHLAGIARRLAPGVGARLVGIDDGQALAGGGPLSANQAWLTSSVMAPGSRHRPHPPPSVRQQVAPGTNRRRRKTGNGRRPGRSAPGPDRRPPSGTSGKIASAPWRPGAPGHPPLARAATASSASPSRPLSENAKLAQQGEECGCVRPACIALVLPPGWRPACAASVRPGNPSA
jgi:hypothetical protein